MSVGVPLASDVGAAGYRGNKRFPAQGNPSRFLCFVCRIVEGVRASGVGFVFCVVSAGVFWASDVGGVGYLDHKRNPAQCNPSRFLSFVCPILEYVRTSGVVVVFSVACVGVPWPSDVGAAGYL